MIVYKQKILNHGKFFLLVNTKQLRVCLVYALLLLLKRAFLSHYLICALLVYDNF